MKQDPHAIEPPHGAGIGSYASYGLGYLLCLGLTLAAYFSASYAIAVSTGLLQIIVQLILFLHLNSEKRPRWNLIVFLFMVLIAAILVIGSLWIMANLDYRMME